MKVISLIIKCCSFLNLVNGTVIKISVSYYVEKYLFFLCSNTGGRRSLARSSCTIHDVRSILSVNKSVS